MYSLEHFSLNVLLIEEKQRTENKLKKETGLIFQIRAKMMNFYEDRKSVDFHT